MNFSEKRIDQKELTSPRSLYHLILCDLCGKVHAANSQASIECIQNNSSFLEKFIEALSNRGLFYQQFNELLLLVRMKRVSEGFFQYFFQSTQISEKELKNGIILFRGIAMLCFGNFNFAYKTLRNNTKEEIERIVSAKFPLMESDPDAMRKRKKEIVSIDMIDIEETWLTGYLSGKEIVHELEIINQAIDDPSSRQGCDEEDSKEFYRNLSKYYKDLAEKQRSSKAMGEKNTQTYLTWDYLDVYVATSMRKKWEYVETALFLKKIFLDRKLATFNLRYFDPTQSYCSNRFDKGLIEGLMLKRAMFTLYMAQESDTMGKDSELAATLSQGKPVIAYVPEIEVDTFVNTIQSFPIGFIRKRYLLLLSEEIFFEIDDRLRRINSNFMEKLKEFVDFYEEFLDRNPFTLHPDHDVRFKREYKDFSLICNLIAEAEKEYYDRRARALREFHPLGIQVNLATGVGNGVLVVRNEKECIKLIHRLVTGELDFEIKHTGEENKGATTLIEKTTQCHYRVVTDDINITNSFWNFYLE